MKSQFKNRVDFAASIRAKNPGDVAMIGISIEENPQFPFVVHYLVDGEKSRSIGYDSGYANLRLTERGVLNGSNQTLLSVSSSELPKLLEQAEAARHIRRSRYATPKQKQVAIRTLAKFRAVYNRIREAGQVLNTWLEQGGWPRNIGMAPVTTAVQIPLVTPRRETAGNDGLTQAISRMPVVAFILTGDKLVFVEDVKNTIVAWNEEQVAPDFRFGIDLEGTILGFAYIEGNLECAVTAADFQQLLTEAVKRADEDGYATMAVKPYSTIALFSETSPFKYLGDIAWDEKEKGLVHEAVTTTEHILVDATNLFAKDGAINRIIKSGPALNNGETRIVQTAESLRNKDGERKFVALDTQDDRTGTARFCEEPKLATQVA